MSVNDVVTFAITGDPKQSGMSPQQLDEDLSWTNYMYSLADVFMDK